MARKAQKSALDVFAEEIKRLKSRVKMLRKLRDQVLITVQEPNGVIMGSYTIPSFVYYRNAEAVENLRDRMDTQFNQQMLVHHNEDLVVCDTLVDLESALNELNQVEDDKEEDGIEDNR
jgi:hypothetical protein